MEEKSAATKKRISYLSISVSLSYSSFLVSTSTLQSYPEAITAVLPCFWSYAEIADHHRNKLRTNQNRLYKDWAEVYTTDSYLTLVEKIKTLVNRAAGRLPLSKINFSVYDCQPIRIYVLGFSLPQEKLAGSIKVEESKK